MNHGGRRDRMGSLITTTYAICAYTLSLCFTPLSTIFQLYRGGVLLVEETRVPGENHRPATSHCQTLSHTCNIVVNTSKSVVKYIE
jgi:hypothetical protein